MLKGHAERSPLRRNVDAGEVGATAAFLLSPGGSGITGETITSIAATTSWVFENFRAQTHHRH